MAELGMDDRIYLRPPGDTGQKPGDQAEPQPQQPTRKWEWVPEELRGLAELIFGSVESSLRGLSGLRDPRGYRWIWRPPVYEYEPTGQVKVVREGYWDLVHGPTDPRWNQAMAYEQAVSQAGQALPMPVVPASWVEERMREQMAMLAPYFQLLGPFFSIYQQQLSRPQQQRGSDFLGLIGRILGGLIKF
jgi:hypothetical protein